MGDIRNWDAFIRGRWNWTGYGYEEDFPRKCQFTDIDAGIEFDGYRLIIECKHYDGKRIGLNLPDTGQLILLRTLVAPKATVLVLYGDAPTNDPQALRILGAERSDDVFLDWRKIKTVEERRRLLKQQINMAMGLAL